MARLSVALFCAQTRRTPCKRDRGRADPYDPHAAMGYTFPAVSRSMPDSFVQIEIPDRALFKASEVCDLVKLQPYVLRSWEAEFPDLGVAKAAGGPRVYRRADVEQVVRIKHLLLVEGLTLAGARRKLDEEGAPVAADAAGHRRARREECAGAADGGQTGLRSILDLIGSNGDTREFRLSPPAAEPRSRSKPAARSEGAARKAAAPASRQRRRNLARGAITARSVGRASLQTGCSAAWLAHLTGGQGVAGSNPAIPTIFVRYFCDLVGGRRLSPCGVTPGVTPARKSRRSRAFGSPAVMYRDSPCGLVTGKTVAIDAPRLGIAEWTVTTWRMVWQLDLSYLR